ncbi:MULTISPECIES: FtsX-like permease family protein [unclassified Sporosarcina]|uniref:FtsX-like permease family protein n=1 Tax=unclassified Sporosarcina TaxID=2647733 RepID=UPI00203A5098|nr:MULTISPECIES: ABC transporter permease [unclassified Sporosarcina]GKV67351.1 ABC transporter permease [Sporosarcina sp. NCCP-2331]GLB57707.1 ABC transporter permease [Sporosarcina sp. NCCP-2378]
MFFKIAINNVKRSFKDYTIYFLTLTLAVCIFYSFNSINSQNSILELNKNANFISTLNKLIAGTSVFVSFILGGLIIYANKILIKKRKKELGLYMTLGMPKSKISKILIFETLLIGALSLVAGILLGIIVSQGLSLLVANILSVDLNKYKFIISLNAVGKSVIYFGLIYILVMIFNQFTISKFKLIDMLNAAKKNEEVKLKNSFVSLIIFATSVTLLVTAYARILKTGLSADNTELSVTVVMGVMGTLLFFFSLSNFFIHIVQKNKRIYLKDINIFVLRQINNKINTNFLSMTVICLMMFITIALLFAAFDLKGTIDKNLEESTPFDASAFLVVNNENKDPKVNDIEEYLNKINFTFDNHEKKSFYSEFKLNLTIEELLSEYLNNQERIDLQKNYLDGAVSAVKISDYNSIIQLKGQEPLDLQENEVLIVSNYALVNDALPEYMENENIVHIEDKAYKIKNDYPIEENVKSTGGNKFFYFIIPDNFDGSLQTEFTSFNVMYDNKSFEKSEEKFSTLFNNLSKDKYRDISPALVIGSTREQIEDKENGFAATIVFIGLFLGLIFIISSAAVMALQQLSDASDSLERYKSLKKIGVTEKLINKAILRQSLIYFLVPLSLAVIHSIVGISAVNEIFNFHYQSIIVSSLLLFIIYGAYFYATYIGVKNIVKNSN